MEYLIGLLLILVTTGFRIIKQYERGVIFRLGKLSSIKEPGLNIIIPLIDQMRRIDMRVVTMPIQPQKIITRDNVSIDVSAVA